MCEKKPDMSGNKRKTRLDLSRVLFYVYDRFVGEGLRALPMGAQLLLGRKTRPLRVLSRLVRHCRGGNLPPDHVSSSHFRAHSRTGNSRSASKRPKAFSLHRSYSATACS